MNKKRKRPLNLTPLIDVMTTLIIFILIQSSDSTVKVNDSIRLAKNDFGDVVKENQNITVGLKDLTIGDDFKLKLKNGLFNKNQQNKKERKLIEPLYNKVSDLRAESEKEKDQTEHHKFNINVSFDRRIPADSVKKVIYTITMAGVDNIFYIGEDSK